MIAYGYGKQTTDCSSDAYLAVNNCGYFLQIHDILTQRPDGRTDYQLLYIDAGGGRLDYGGKLYHLNGGMLVLYPPHMRQHYRFDAQLRSDFYWIHFAGSGAEALLQSLGLAGGVYHTGPLPGFVSLCKAMTLEAQLRRSAHRQMTAALCMQLLVLSARAAAGQVRANGRLEQVLELMHSGAGLYDNDYYAQLCGVTKFHFIKLFKQYTGQTPHIYQTVLLMDKAAMLLETTDMRVGEIAAFLGYDDPFYFSRLFRKYKQTSPKAYRIDKKSGQEP